MADRSTIEWTDATWNPIGGCTRVDEGCRNCYAEIMAARFSGSGQWGEGLARIVGADGARDHRWTGKMRFNEAALDRPLRWRSPRKIFVNSTSDLFHESVPDEWIDRVFAVKALCPQHTFQVLTKRPDRALAYLTRPAGNGKQDVRNHIAWEAIGPVMDAWAPNWGHEGIDGPHRSRAIQAGTRWPLPNVWLGTSIHDQASADKRIPELRVTPAAVRFVSAEPLLGPVDLRHMLDGIDLVIVGGESGPHARPMHPDWARSLRDQCVAAGVAFHFKQWGEWEPRLGFACPDDLPREGWHHFDPECSMRRAGKRAAGRLLDGRTWDQMPGVQHG